MGGSEALLSGRWTSMMWVLGVACAPVAEVHGDGLWGDAVQLWQDGRPVRASAQGDGWVEVEVAAGPIELRFAASELAVLAAEHPSLLETYRPLARDPKGRLDVPLEVPSFAWFHGAARERMAPMLFEMGAMDPHPRVNRLIQGYSASELVSHPDWSVADVAHLVTAGASELPLADAEGSHLLLWLDGDADGLDAPYEVLWLDLWVEASP